MGELVKAVKGRRRVQSLQSHQGPDRHYPASTRHAGQDRQPCAHAINLPGHACARDLIRTEDGVRELGMMR